MSRFDVYKNPEGDGYLLDVQADLLNDLNTRMVVPLLPLLVAPKPAQHLNPRFEIQKESVVMATQFMAAVPSYILRNPITNIESNRNSITAAIDFLMQGY